MERITVSPDMIVIVGSGPVGTLDLEQPVVMALFFSDQPTLAIGDRSDATLRLCVSESACRRLFDHVPDSPETYHLPADLRAIALAVRDCRLAGPAGVTLRGAKCIELLCGIFGALTGDTLIRTSPEGALSELDTRRMMLARRMIDDRWREKLTIDGISRACGVNRAKLTHGFRSVFGVSVADAIAERRLGGARQMLLATDLPVSSVGYACGYLNSASFTRAFARRYGIVPTRLRAGGSVAA